MNETTHPSGAPNASSSIDDDRMRVPDTSMLPNSEKDRTAATSFLKNAAQGAHATIDRLADGAAPVVRQLGDGVAAAEVALQAKADQLRGTRDAWAEGARNTVRSNPLATIAGALALGLVIAGITRWRRPLK